MSNGDTAADDVWTVQRILQWTTDFLRQKNIELPRLEAELLLAHARQCPRIRLYTDFEIPLTTEERARMRDYVTRRSRREPLAYITGHREFYGREFLVGAGVLVPRPETETLVDVCLDYLPKSQATLVAEVGVGSGCIAVTLARQRPLCRILATDISTDALTFASENVRTHQVEAQVQLIDGDGLTPFFNHHTAAAAARPRCSEEEDVSPESVSAAPEPVESRSADLSNGAACFDGIVSNPPYLRDEVLQNTAAEIRLHEDPRALVSGEDGLDLVRILIRDAPQILKPGGWMALEVDPQQCATVAELLKAQGFADIHIH
ncbi:MAG: peptide chain release factor N(5)-glutamine methyltransferase, partial [Planctomycetaceae bacterium]|nr:peptide chain release factor N(5)-glutamine methyltransferase [Planctomycetaceae bacterium]